MLHPYKYTFRPSGAKENGLKRFLHTFRPAGATVTEELRNSYKCSFLCKTA
ncbi:hypothetical protein JT359_00530 [Candidatus Poribacteria bacterium]|nr:hypothetical protein [Candidatus Poribacteria bacterium]